MAMPPYARAAFIRDQLNCLLNSTSAPSADPAAKHPEPVPLPQQPKPKKARTRSSKSLAGAKNVLRAATAITSKSLAPSSARRISSGGGPQFIHQSPDIARHRRKCAICHHPERETIEDLFIHWHSPESIASHYDDLEQDTESITWISIYRHAYAFGLDEIRRRNLRFVFEHILDQAGTTAATPASIIVAARALGSCINANGEWNEPPKRVLVTNIIRNETPQTNQVTAAPSGVNSRSVIGESSAKGGTPLSVPDQTDALSGQPSVSSDDQVGSENPASRALPTRVLVAPVPASLPLGFRASKIRNSTNCFKSNEPPISNR